MQTGVEADCLKEATVRFESRLHAAAAAYVHGLHGLPLANTAAMPAEGPWNEIAKSSDAEQGAGAFQARKTHILPCVDMRDDMQALQYEV